MDQDTTLSIALELGLISNDTDVDSDPLTAVLVEYTGSGELTVNADGSFAYTPVTGFFGQETFTYKVNDPTEDSNIATVTITVNEVVEEPEPETGSGTGLESGTGSTTEDGGQGTEDSGAGANLNGNSAPPAGELVIEEEEPVEE